MDTRDRRIVERVKDLINHKGTPDADAEAGFHALRRLMRKYGMTLGQVLGGVGGASDEIVDALTRERDYWRKAHDRLERKLARQTEAANQARSENADGHAAEVAKTIRDIRRQHPHISTDEIAAELKRRKVKTARGSTNWTRMQVHRILQRAGL